MRVKEILAFGFIAVVFAVSVSASGFYISPKGSDDVGTGTESNPWKTAVRAFRMGGGNTFIFKDGLYDYDEGFIINPPSGEPSKPTIIKAQNPGKAIINGGSSRTGIVIGDDTTTRKYIMVEGFKVINNGNIPAIVIGSPDGTLLGDQTNNITIRQTGAAAGIQSANDAVWGVGRVRDSLFEDIWAWGEGRYTFNAYGCTRVTVRRAVFRWDGWGEGADKPNDPQFNMGVYNTHNSVFENIILLDHANSSSRGDSGALYLPGNDNGKTAPYTSSDGNSFFGLVILNNFGAGIGVEGGTGEQNKNNSFIDIVSWDNTEIGVTVPKKSVNTYFDRITIGKSGPGTYFGTPGTTFKNSLVDPKLKYITRSESGEKGANVVKRYENGKLTNTELWPYPFEGRIKADMCSGVSTGFCAASSLTHYIWNYLGNGNPYQNAPAVLVAPAPTSTPAPKAVMVPESALLDSSDPLRAQKNSMKSGEEKDIFVFGKDAKYVWIVNAGGREVVHLTRQGVRRISWDGRKIDGEQVEPGFYMCRIEDANGKSVRQMISVIK